MFICVGGFLKPKVFIIGHSHIDAAWLWRKNETVKVCKDTFSNVLSFMEKYPELKFVQSSPQYYIWIERNNRRLFEKIREKVEEGRW